MEQYENNGTQTEFVDVSEETSQSTGNLEANETDNDNSTGAGDGAQNSEPSLNQQLEALGLSREEYFKLKGQESSQGHDESREESRQQTIASDDATLGRLEARGVMDEDDQAYVLKAAQTLGVSPVQALDDAVVSDRLAANAKARETAAATPSSTNRVKASKPSIDTYIAKGEIPEDDETFNRMMSKLAQSSKP